MQISDQRDIDLNYPLLWMPNYQELNSLITAAYPEMKAKTESVMVHARTRAKLHLAIKLAEHLGLLYFGYKDVQTRDTYTLQFSNQERLAEYSKSLDNGVRLFDLNTSVVELAKFERSWFINTFWQQLLPETLIRKTLKQGLVLADLHQAITHKEKRMAVLLGGELNSFDLIINTLKTNGD
jgi:hypothetical protein